MRKYTRMDIKLLKLAAKYAPYWAYKILFDRELKRMNQLAARELWQ